MNSLAIWGALDQARILESYIQESGQFNEIKFFDPENVSKLRGSPNSTDFETLIKLLKSFDQFVVGIGGTLGFARFSISTRLQEIGLSPFSYIHKTAFIDSTTKISAGVQVFPHATIGKFVSIAQQVIINTASTIDHDSIIGNGVHIMGSASLAGRVTVGDFASIGTNATVLPRISIGKGCVIGAGAVVTKSTQEMGVYVGVPARKIGESEILLNSSMLI